MQPRHQGDVPVPGLLNYRNSKMASNVNPTTTKVIHNLLCCFLKAPISPEFPLKCFSNIENFIFFFNSVFELVDLKNSMYHWMFQKISKLPLQKGLESPGVGFCKTKMFKEMCEAYWNF